MPRPKLPLPARPRREDAWLSWLLAALLLQLARPPCSCRDSCAMLTLALRLGATCSGRTQPPVLQSPGAQPLTRCCCRAAVLPLLMPEQPSPLLLSPPTPVQE